jgi:hypothetical protein
MVESGDVSLKFSRGGSSVSRASSRKTQDVPELSDERRDELTKKVQSMNGEVRV